jgi:hypothetical protein
MEPAFGVKCHPGGRFFHFWGWVFLSHAGSGPVGHRRDLQEKKETSTFSYEKEISQGPKKRCERTVFGPVPLYCSARYGCVIVAGILRPELSRVKNPPVQPASPWR